MLFWFILYLPVCLLSFLITLAVSLIFYISSYIRIFPLVYLRAFLCDMFSVTWAEFFLFFSEACCSSEFWLLCLYSSFWYSICTYVLCWNIFASTSSLNEVILCGTAVCSAVVKARRWILIWDHNFRKKMLSIQLLAFPLRTSSAPDRC